MTSDKINPDIDDKIQKAVEALGYKDKTITTEDLGLGRYEVYVDYESIGIYDTVRNTFVD